MLTGFFGIFGALAGLVPSILQFFTLRANNAQAIELKKLDIEAAKENISLQVDLASAQADIEQQRNVYNYASAPSGIKWVDALAVFVRPYITLVMFHAWVALEGFMLLYGIANGVNFEQMVSALWDADIKSLFAAIIGFWFGDRGGKKLMAATLAVTQPQTVTAVRARTPPSPTHVPDPPGSRT